jgi:3'(2'), 5'-bisphosphate nucleotidase
MANDAAHKDAALDTAGLGEKLADIVEAAGREIMPLWRSADLGVDRKADESPVTEADRRGEKLILERLAAEFPNIPVVSEEDASESGTPAEIGSTFFLVDPLDGTKAFVRGDEHWTVNIGLVVDGAPVAGAVSSPAWDRTWYTTSEGARRRTISSGEGAPIAVRPWPGDKAIALVSHTATPEQKADLRAQYGFGEELAMDSSAKICMIAEATADIYPRHGTTMEWDIAAAHAVLVAAGGRVETPEGQPFLYGKADKGFKNGWFVARGG